MSDPFDLANNWPPIKPRTFLSSYSDADLKAEQQAELASLDALLVEYGLSPPEETVEDDDLENAVAAAERSFARTGAPLAKAGSSIAAPCGVTTSKGMEDFPELTGDQGAIVMPYDSHRATRVINEQKALFRTLSTRSTWLTDPHGVPANLGSGSGIPLLHKTIKEKEQSKAIGEFRNLFPTWFPETPTPDRSLVVETEMPASLPRWKDKPGPSKATREDRQFMLAIQFASLAAADPTIGDLHARLADPAVGFFSMTLPEHLHGKILGSKPAELFHKNLMRRVLSFAPDFAGVFTWRREVDDSITLFGMLKACSGGSDGLAAEAAAGRRFGLALLKAGLRPATFNSISEEEWARLYGLVKEVFLRGWANGNDEYMSDWAPEMQEAIEFDFSTKQFRTAFDIAVKARKHMAIWNDFVLRCGLPIWFGGKMLDVFLDVFVRTKEMATRRRQAVADSENRNGRQRVRKNAKAALAEIDAALPDDLATLRFYTGSPAQYAALVMRQGELLGSYCDVIVSTRCRNLYDVFRDKL